jgi:hypothetical protein
VASGAVLRAFNKDKGPRRYARSSYGILRTEHYKDFPEHEGVKPYHDRRDGQAYVAHTVDWVLKLVMMKPLFLGLVPYVQRLILNKIANYMLLRVKRSSLSGHAPRSSPLTCSTSGLPLHWYVEK